MGRNLELTLTSTKVDNDGSYRMNATGIGGVIEAEDEEGEEIEVDEEEEEVEVEVGDEDGGDLGAKRARSERGDMATVMRVPGERGVDEDSDDGTKGMVMVVVGVIGNTSVEGREEDQAISDV